MKKYEYGTINADGNLEGKFCPFSPIHVPCGKTCPHFGTPTELIVKDIKFTTGGKTEKHMGIYFLDICHNKKIKLGRKLD